MSILTTSISRDCGEGARDEDASMISELFLRCERDKKSVKVSVAVVNISRDRCFCLVERDFK